MIRLAMSARDRRTLAFGLLGMGSIIGLGKGIPALRQWERARSGAAAESITQLRVERASARLLPAIRDTLRARKRRFDALDSVLFAATIPAEASSQLAAVLADYAEASQVRVTTVQVRHDTATKSPLLRIGARLTGAGDVTALATLLETIEGDETPLAVRELSVSQSEPAAPDTRPEILRFELLVEGLARLQKASP